MLDRLYVPAFVSLTATMPALLVDAIVKVTLVLAIAGTVTFLLRRQSAAQRHAIWSAAILASVLLPCATVVLPSWPILPQWLTTSRVTETASSITSDQPERGATTELHRHPGHLPMPASSPTAAVPPQNRPDTQALEPSYAAPHRQPTAQQTPESTSRKPTSQAHLAPVPLPSARNAPLSTASLSNGLIAIWLAGLGICCLRLLIGVRRLRQIRRHSRPLTKGPIVTIHESVRQAFCIRRPVRLLLSQGEVTPMVWGILTPRILLPSSATRWSAERLRAVLTHEMSHIGRRDLVTQWFVHCACFLYWFHPLVWIAAWRTRVEREQACDDMVIMSGIEATEYAEHLLRITAGAARYPLTHVVSLGMSRSHRLESRLVALLNARTKRTRSAHRTIAATAALVLLVSLPIAMLRATPASEPPASDPAASDPAAPEQRTNRTTSPSTSSVAGATGALYRVGYVDNSAEGRRSIAGSGHAVSFTRPKGARYLMAVEVFASRYGTIEPPAEDFHLYVLDENKQLIQAIPFPYKMIERGEARWYTLKVPATKVPKSFHVAISFNPHQTKGIFMGFDTHVEQSHSLTGRPTEGFRPVTDRFDWMIRGVLVPGVPAENPFNAPHRP